MINIKDMEDELKNYVIKHITVHSFPNLEPGLLKEGSNICIACYQVILKKFNAYERGAEFTPGKKKQQTITIGSLQKESINHCTICKQKVSKTDNRKKFRDIRPLTTSILENDIER